MVYPTVVITFAFLVLTFMLLFIIPVFSKIFDQLHGNLPVPTQIIVTMSHALRHYWFIIFPFLIALIFGFRKLKRTEEGRKVWDRFRLHAAMKIGDVVQKFSIARL